MTEFENAPRTPIIRHPHNSSGEVKNLSMSIFKSLRSEVDRTHGTGHINGADHHSDHLNRSNSRSRHHSGSSSKSGLPHTSATNTINLNIKLESPPIMLYGNYEESSGSILSGLLFLKTESEVQLSNVTLSLVQTINLTKPFVIGSNTVSSCSDCSKRENILAQWDVVTSDTKFTPGSHAYPFSHLLPGSLPASSKLGSKYSTSYVKYDLIATAKPQSTTPIELKLPVNISRSILRGPDRNSLRVFPPTEVSSSAVLPNVIYPKSTFPVELKFDNMVAANGEKRWRMRKLIWRIEENTRVKAFCCDKHKSKLKQIEDSQKKTKVPAKAKSGNVHYSTIQTAYTLSPDMSDDARESINRQINANDATGVNGAPLINVDMTEVERTAPSHATDNFIEDFSPPTESEGDVATPPTAAQTLGTPLASTQSLGTPSPVSNYNSDLHLYLSESRTVSHGEIKSGWKSDFSGSGRIELVANINAMDLSTGLVKPCNNISSEDKPKDELMEGLRNGANISCDIEDPNEGIFVSHLLVVEIVIAEESISKKQPVPTKTSTQNSSVSNENPQPNGTPTGAARVLRMQFKLTFSERSGLGISWDDEVPPTYDDVRTLSPPTYEASTPLANGTPGSGILSHITNSNLIVGVGDTPLGASIDSMFNLEDRIQDFTL